MGREPRRVAAISNEALLLNAENTPGNVHDEPRRCGGEDFEVFV